MWHEARRQERKIRGMLVDYRRRAERRRDFYEKIKADPTQFLQIHGRQCKIHLDANIAAAADTAVMMPWQGHADNLIDRFDVRAHLDLIPNIEKAEEEKLTQDERHLNYERYRIIAQNAFLSVPEEKFLKQLHLEEQFGYTEYKTKKDVRTGGAAIGFNYEDSTGIPQESPVEITSEDENSDSDLDVDLAINVSKMDPTQANEMNKHGRSYGMSSNDFYSFLINDLEEAEAVKQAREEEQEKALFSGRKSRRERRYHREKRLANRTISPPSYAAKASPTLLDFHESKSLSRTPSPENSGKITYITSFGEDEETPSTSKPTFASKVKFGKPKPKVGNEKVTVTSSANRRHSRSKSRSNDGYYNKSSRSKNITSKKSKRSRTRSKSRSRRSRSNSRSGYRRQRSRSSSSRSRSYSRSLSTTRRSSSRSRDRSRGYRRRHLSSSSSSSSKSSSRSSSSDSSRRKSPKKKTPEKSRVDHIPVIQESGTEIIPRYYGRRKNDKSSSDLSDLNDDENKPSYDSNGGESQKDTNLIIAKKTTTSMTIIERLKRKRQALLNRQFKADKIAEQAKTEREKLEQQTREDELREMAIKLRKRQREKRHANDSVSSSNSDDSSRSYDSNYSKERSRSRSREKDSRRHHRRTRRNSDDRRSTSRERRRRDRKDRERERDRRGRRSSSPSRGSKDRYRDDREVRLVNY